LIAGLGLQLTSWPQPLIDGLLERGFQLFLIDNRDVGRSGRAAGPPPSKLSFLLGRIPQEGYGLSDMACDVIAVLDAEKIACAHVAGMSMGGMIAQVLAARHPDRVTSLTSIFSTTGARDVGQPELRIMLNMMKPPARTRASAQKKFVDMLQRIGGRSFEVNSAAWAKYAGDAWDRGAAKPEEGVARQAAAIFRSGDRTAELATITTPTLVIHGDHDPLVATSGGRATAAAVAGAQLQIIKGMGHDLADGVLATIIELINSHCKAAQPSSPPS
jgi:non-heme chloroperoxidase